MDKVLVYVAVKMTGRFQDELVKESLMICNALRNWGFEPLSPVIEENIIPIHEVLTQTTEERLSNYWRFKDKPMLQDAHIVLDYMSCNQSDGVSVELGLSRFAYWKPVVRIFPNLGYCIGRLEFDTIVGSLPDALAVMSNQWGTKQKLLIWRLKMLIRCLPKFVALQFKFLMEVMF